MKDALLSHGGIEGVRVADSDSLEESVTGELPKIVGKRGKLLELTTQGL